MIVYGRQPVREALRGRRSVERVWATEGAARAEWLDRVAIERTSGERIASLAETPDHQGICAEVASYPYARAGELLGPEDALVVALDEVHDPRNLGAVCRVAECAGAAGVVIPERRAAEVTPVVCRASAGAVEHLPVARVRNLADWLGEAKAAGAWAYGARSRAPSPTTSPTTAGASSSCSARRGGAFVRGSPPSAIRRSPCRWPGASSRSTSRPRPRP